MATRPAGRAPCHVPCPLPLIYRACRRWIIVVCCPAQRRRKVFRGWFERGPRSAGKVPCKALPSALSTQAQRWVHCLFSCSPARIDFGRTWTCAWREVTGSICHSHTKPGAPHWLCLKFRHIEGDALSCVCESSQIWSESRSRQACHDTVVPGKC